MVNALTDDILGALKGELWVLALAGALALPDMCGALASSNGEATRRGYCKWFDDNLGPLYPKMDAEDAWRLRCSFLHEGKTKPSKYQRVIFTLSRPNQAFFHGNVIDDALNLDLPTFCRDVVAATRLWFAAHRDDPNVARNYATMLKWREDGYPPYIKGVGVLA